MRKQASLTLEVDQHEAPVERLVTAPPSDAPSMVLVLIERLALDPSADVEKLARTMAMYERLKAKEAELAYNAAKGRILKSSPPSRLSRTDRFYTKWTKENHKRAAMKDSNMPRWRRSTNIYVRSWRKKTWISPILTYRKRGVKS